MNKHTPGPWHKSDAATTIPIKAANGKTVASVKWGDNDNSNADLIASSPELLAASQQALCLLEELSEAPSCDEVISNLRVAIAKATGGWP